MTDPIGQELIDKALRENEQHNEFAKRVAFIEDVAARHRYNLGTNMGQKEQQIKNQAEIDKLEGDSSDEEVKSSQKASNLSNQKGPIK